MEAIVPILGSIISAAFLGLTGAVIAYLKNRFDLDPDGQALLSLEVWEEKAAIWIRDEAETRGLDLSIPETRWDLVNEGLVWLIPKIPKLMGFLGYDRKSLAHDIEGLIKRSLK